jgi:2'-5' RNA ligase
MVTYRYLVAYLPDEAVAQQVWTFKHEVAALCGSVRGLKVLPHVTFIPPFEFPEAGEQKLTAQLSALISTFAIEPIAFDGFNYFKGPKSHTIYIAVAATALMNEHQEQLSIYARNKLHRDTRHAPRKFTPHMTIAYRDLDPEKFACAWPRFEHRTFSAGGSFDRLWLLKHYDGRWHPLEAFVFKGKRRELF